MVGINSAILGTEVAPFGRVKESGLGREGSFHGIEEFVEIKYVLMGGIANKAACDPLPLNRVKGSQ